ncbi:MAG TPA: response regulator [Terriglobales bacterium]|nr:response regulator [Terriglobales bacterium]
MIKQPSILLVDDEISILQTLQMVLENEGYRVVTAQSCAEALEVLGNTVGFDAVITDLNMEREDIGLEVARAAQKVNPRPAVIICTGYASVTNSRRALDIGVDYMAHKPMEIPELISAIRRLVTRRGPAWRRA